MHALACSLEHAVGVLVKLCQLLYSQADLLSSFHAMQAVAAAMQQLKAQLRQAAIEAQAFAEQQQADVERAKRSSAQVGPSCTSQHSRLYLCLPLAWAVCAPQAPALLAVGCVLVCVHWLMPCACTNQYIAVISGTHVAQ